MTVVPMPGAEMERRGPTLELAQHVSADGLEQIQRALPEGVSLQKFDTALATAMVANPELAKCDQSSLFLALVKCASSGLMPDSVEAVILPFNNRKKGIVEATFVEMIRGTRLRFARHGWTLTASVVYANDTTEVDKGAGRVTHRPVLTGERGAVIGAYAVAVHRDGRRRMADYMPIDEIYALRDKMGVDGNPSWKKWPNQMAEKTVAHRLGNDIGLADEDRERGEIIDAADLGDPVVALYGPGAASFSELPSGVPPAEPPVEQVTDAASVQGPDGDDTAGGSDDPQGAPSPVAAAAPAVDPVEADLAAEYVPPEGTMYHPKTLKEIHELGDDGVRWLRMCARRDDCRWQQQAATYVAAFLADESKAA